MFFAKLSSSISRESTLLFDEKRSSLEDEFYVLLVICHEVAHSWFGNMATLKWWDNLWMNEAFANTLMYFAMEHIRPDFGVVNIKINKKNTIFSLDRNKSFIHSNL